MKTKTKLTLLLMGGLFALSGCAGREYDSPRGGSFGGDDYSSYEEGGSLIDGSKSGFGSSNENNQISARQLTAKALFDNDDANYQYLCDILDDNQQNHSDFKTYQDTFELDYKRVKVTVENTPYAQVSLLGKNDKKLWDAVADVNGVCYLFSNEEAKKISVTVGEVNKTYDVTNNLVVTDFTDVVEKYNKIQVLFTVDTTGSMSDEITYLQAELTDVIERIEEQANANVEVGIIVYRDKTDAYVTKKCDFTDNVSEALRFLNEQYAKGGGDFPEAVQEAYSVAKQFNWKDDATKILVHVADAPSHDEDVNNWFGSVENLTKLGVRILTVASSGIDLKTEYLFRMQSLQSNGCYSFLTDDSGIGNSHLEADTNADLTVEYLNDMLVRIIKGWHCGNMQSPTDFNLTKYPELLFVNNEINLSFGSQYSFIKQYIAEFGGQEDDAKAGIEDLYVAGKSFIVVRVKDNFTIPTEEDRNVEIGNFNFEFKAGESEVYLFDGENFMTIGEAYNTHVINNEQLETIYNAIYEPELIPLD